MAITYHDDNSISMDVTFSVSVRSLSRTDFDITKVSGSDITCMEYWLTGSGTSYKLWFLPEEDTNGSFSVDFTGNIISGNSLTELIPAEITTLDNVLDLDSETAGVQRTVTIPYDLRVPFVVDSYVPTRLTEQEYDSDDYSSEPGWQIYIEFNVNIIGLQKTDFIYEGVNFTPSVIQRLASSSTTVTKNASDTNGAHGWSTPNNETDWVNINSNGDGPSTVPSKFFRLIFHTDGETINTTIRIILRDAVVTNAANVSTPTYSAPMNVTLTRLNTNRYRLAWEHPTGDTHTSYQIRIAGQTFDRSRSNTAFTRRFTPEPNIFEIRAVYSNNNFSDWVSVNISEATGQAGEEITAFVLVDSSGNALTDFYRNVLKET